MDMTSGTHALVALTLVVALLPTAHALDCPEGDLASRCAGHDAP